MAKKKSQTWSFDIVVATIIFVGVFLLVFFITSEKVNHPTNKKIFVQQDSIDRVFSIRTNPDFGFLTDQNVVDPEKLLTFTEVNYDKVKEKLGSEYDFCIIFENEFGKIEPIILDNGKYLLGIGSKLVEIEVEGKTYYCGTEN
jgi:hypothetical protein